MNRMRTFDVPHKGIRNALSQLSLLAGKTDYREPGAVRTLCELGADVFSILSIHAADENEVTLTHLEQRMPGASQHDREEHEHIEAAQLGLETLLRKMEQEAGQGTDLREAGAAFYSGLNDFHAMYLQHMAEEEKDTLPLLWKFFTDDELAGHRRQIIARNPPETLLTWFRFVFPAQSCAENAALLKGFRLNAPPALVARGMEVIEAVLSKTEFQALKQALT